MIKNLANKLDKSTFSRQLGYTHPKVADSYATLLSCKKISMQKNQISKISKLFFQRYNYQGIGPPTWKRAFWPIICESEFSKILDFQRKTDNFKVFHFRLLPAKSNNKIL